MEQRHFPEEPFTDFSYVFFIRGEDAGRLKHETFNDLKRHTVGIVGGFSYTPEIKAFLDQEKNFQEANVGLENFRLPKRKRVGYVATSKRVGLNHIRELGMEDVTS